MILGIVAGQRSLEQIIQNLFAQGQQGFWLPFTDFASLSQDSAGTLPYTALEQPVGLILDKSRGGGRGSELSPNGGTFNDATGWTITNPTSSISGGVLNVGAGDCNVFPSTASVVAGKSYEIVFTISNSTANYGIRILNRNLSNSGNYFAAGGQYFTANGTYKVVFVALANGSIGVNRVNVHTGTLQVDNFSVKEIPGNHAMQPTSAARGVVSARVNMFTETEFRGAGVVTGSGFTYSSLGGYLGALRFTHNATTDYAYKSGSVAVGLVCVFSVVVKMDDGSAPLTAAQNPSNDFMLVVNGGQAQAASTVPLGGGLYRLTTNPILINSGNIGIVKYSNNSAKPFTATAYSLVPITQAALPYQRVNTPTDYDSVGFPNYLRLDGTDDSYTCGEGGYTTGFYWSDVIRPIGSGSRTLFYNSSYGSKSGFSVVVTAANKLAVYVGDGASFTMFTSAETIVNGELAHCAVWDDVTNIYMQVNGGVVQSFVKPVMPAGPAKINLYNTGAVEHFNGQATEPIYRAGPPPSAYEREVIRAYQMQKAGML